MGANDDFDFADQVIYDLFQQRDLKQLFDKRINDLGLSLRAVQNEIGMEYRPLKKILEGKQKNVDLLAISRLANFMQIPVEKLVNMILEKIEQNFTGKFSDIEKQEFIIKHFDLYRLKKCGFIESISDFHHIEERVVDYFGLKSLYDYGKDLINVLYSSGKPKPENSLMRDFWGESATRKLKTINNHNQYDRAGLISYIPSIRWHSRDERYGLFQVVRELYKYGVTVIYEPYITTIYVRGATFPVNGKPCIVLTDYRNYYPTIWFALIHEIHHVLFDWEDIKANKPHFSSEIDRHDKREVEADNFAREYLFSKDKMKVVSPQIDNQTFVEQYAKAFDIHPSLIYSFYCWDNLDSEVDVFKKYKSKLLSAREALATIDPDSALDLPWKNRMPIESKSNELRKGIFNNL